MSDDDTAGPSLLLAQHDKAHREHSHSHSHSHLRSQQLQHQHHRLHKKQDGTEVVTEVVATISVLQQIDVDRNGNTITTQTTLADSTSYASSAGVLTSASSISPASSPTVSDTASPSIISSNSPASSTIVDSSLLSGLDISSVQTSTPSISPNFASFSVSANSTTLIPSSSSLTQTFSNSSISSTSSSSRSSLSYFRASSLRSSRGSSSTGSTSSLYSPSSSSYLATGTDVVGNNLGAGTGVAGGPESTSSSNSAGGSNSDATPTPTPVVIGGVVGSIAGAAVIILGLLFLLRWKKRGQMLPLGSGNGGAETIQEGPTTQPPGVMKERRSLAFAVPAALASLTGYKRHSQKTDRTISSTAGSERGFYRVSGRKLPSVLQTGGDGYGRGIPDENTLSGSSFYRDSEGFFGGPGGPSSPPVGISMQRDSGIPIMRPSPARTPVTEHGPWPSPDLNSPPRRPDVLGRSRPSQDGSHTSKFIEEV